MIEGRIRTAGDHQDTRKVELPRMKPILRTSETKDRKRRVLDIIRATLG